MTVRNFMSKAFSYQDLRRWGMVRQKYPVADRVNAYYNFIHVDDGRAWMLAGMKGLVTEEFFVGILCVQQSRMIFWMSLTLER